MGALGSNSRLEYMAIGDAVNLAARFGSLAADGEIWVDERTGTLARLPQDQACSVAQVKGIGEVRYPSYAGNFAPSALPA